VSDNLVLFGAGACGRYALKFLREKGIEPYAFVDNNEAKWGTLIEGVSVFSPEEVLEFKPNSTWVATAISRPAATEIRAQMKSMGVNTKPLWECIPVHHGLPSDQVQSKLIRLSADASSVRELMNQFNFREKPDYDKQIPPSPMSELYFPDFITHLDDEHFVDCGAADGDTIQMFMDRWAKWGNITAFEPDISNFEKLRSRHYSIPNINGRIAAVGDREHAVAFESNGDYSSRIIDGVEQTVMCVRLDDQEFVSPPTYIKADVEGSELELLWGARRIIKEHAPVLAVCAYHESPHLWEIPLLIHALNPEYKLYFRRYGEGAFEIIWYAVPPERVK